MRANFKGDFTIKSLIVLILLFCLVLSPINYGQSLPSESWIKVNTYAEYTFNATAVGFLNKTAVDFKGGTKGIWRWDCVALNGNKASLNVSLTLEGKNGFALSKLIYVDIKSNEAFLDNGSSIGPVFLWGASDLTEGQTITLWDRSSFEVKGNVTKIGVTLTPKGPQNISVVEAQGKVDGRSIYVIAFYDFSTGVFVDGHIDGDATLFALGVEFIGRDGRILFSDTNIDLGPAWIPPSEQGFPVMLILPPTLFCILFLTFLYFRKPSKRNKKNR